MRSFFYVGTGKTTTLLKYTQLRPGTRFLLLVYNKLVGFFSAETVRYVPLFVNLNTFFLQSLKCIINLHADLWQI